MSSDDKNGALEALVSDLKLWACSPRVPLKAQLVMLEAIGRLASAPSATAPLDTEAVAWAYRKLQTFGVHQGTMDSAMMMDRLNAILHGASTDGKADG